jgi:DNA repair protein RecN (Recombination protein N)
MLTELTIEDFAIIDRLLLRLEPGFTVLTGETGAGKSIIIDALQAALGAKVPGDVVRSGAKAASVEAIFELSDEEREALGHLLDEYGAADDDVLIFRREVSAAGRATARLNGRAVPASVLSQAGAALVDIHGQSEHLSVLRRDRQLDILDRYGGLMPLRGDVAEAVHRLSGLRRQLREVTSGQREAEQRLDLLRFQAGEIEAAQLRPGEEEELGVERNLLVNAERLTSLASTAYDALQAGPAPAVDSVGDAVTASRDLAAIDPELAGISERLQSAQFEIEDIAGELRRYRDTVEYDPQRLEAIEERLDLLMRLRRKYGPTLEDVIAFGAEVQSQLHDVENLDERISALEQDTHEAERSSAGLAGRLSQERASAAAELTGAMAEALQGLGLKGTSFDVQIEREESPDGLPIGEDGPVAYTSTGIDQVTFLVSFNPGEPLRPLERVASGGETSRFLLALKSVLAGADRIPTLVFDEVDVGVGGRRAMDVGQRMRSLATSHQVLTITHMPQIAALADQHLTVLKAVRHGRTTVDVRALERGERVTEIAEMMSGTGSEAARRNAEELLESARQGQ